MENYVEKQLRIKSENTHSTILYSQWKFDKSLIPESLNAISNIFPHYSLHNASHSEAILANIIKILGEDFIDELSCTDLWLLLESAYCHDMGMIITHHMAKEAIISKDFLSYIEEVQNNPTHDLNKLKDNIIIKEDKVHFSDTLLDIEKIDITRFMLADFFRAKHALISSDFINNPENSIALKSPRAVIPSRLYSILGKICSSHTKNFKDVMGIPFYEDGVDTENAHPRFIACMLRLGDLLDIDNYRFSETQLKTLSFVPRNSLNHREKHLAVNHKCINNKYIEITATCKDVKVAKITQDWFNWIQEEINNQTLEWHNIVPDGIKSILPKVKLLKVDIDGYDSLDNRNRSSFTIDTPKALELLQGGNFYKDPFDAIREAIQNAVDSTLIRIWIENKDVDFNITSLLKLAKNYPINILIEETPNRTFSFKIIDRGTGINKTDLQFLSNTGSSVKNKYRQDIIRSMPTWMQPAGVFGIGFQSLFLLTDLIKIKTQSIFSGEKMEAELYNPISDLEGDIYIKSLNSFMSSGTEISMDVSRANYISEEEHIIIDRFSENENDAIFEKMMNKVRVYAESSFIPITLNGTPIDRILYDHCSSDNSVEIKFHKIDSQETHSFFFKNSLITDYRIEPYMRLLYADINYHKANSKDILDISRDKFKEGALKIIFADIYSAITEFILSSKESNWSAPGFAYYHSETYPIQYDKIRKNISNYIQNLSLPLIGKNKSIKTNYSSKDFKTIKFKEIFKRGKILIIYGHLREYSIEVKDNEIVITMNDSNIKNIVTDVIRILIKEAKKIYPYSVLAHTSKEILDNVSIVVFEKDRETKSDYKVSDISDMLKHDWSGDRFFIPYMEGYDNIKIQHDKPNDNMECRIHTGYTIGFIEFDRILSPFIKRNGKWVDKRTHKFYEWVFNNRGEENITIDDIKSDYDKLIRNCRKANIEFL